MSGFNQILDNPSLNFLIWAEIRQKFFINNEFLALILISEQMISRKEKFFF